MPLLLPIYLSIGLVVAGGYAFLITKGVERSERDPEVRAAVRENENAVGRMPGGMLTVLIILTALWPVAVAWVAVSALKGKY